MNSYCYYWFFNSKSQSQTCNLKENMCVIVIDTYNYIAGFKPTPAAAIATDC